MAYLYICKGRDATGWSGFMFQNSLPKAVNMRGALSPAIRAKASMTLVTMPALAVRNTTERMVRHLGMPRPRAASRMDCGTSNRTSSVVREITGIIMMPRATLPARREKCFCETTTKAHAVMPITTEGTPFNASAVKRTILPNLFRPYSAKKTPAPIPNGTPIRLAKPKSRSDPTIALPMPPPSSPIGLGIWVRKAQFKAPNPRTTTVPRIRKRGTVTISAANVMRPSAIELESLRRREVVWISLGKGPRQHSPGDGPDQQHGQGVHYQGYHK